VRRPISSRFVCLCHSLERPGEAARYLDWTSRGLGPPRRSLAAFFFASPPARLDLYA